MPRKLAQIQEQINRLQRQARELRSREASGVIKRIKTAIEHYNITPQDLFGSSGTSMPKGSRAKGRSTNGSAPKGQGVSAGRRPKAAQRPRCR